MNVLFFIWIVSAAATDAGSGCTGNYSETCQAGGQVGKGIAILLILFVAGVLNLILGVIWMVTRKSRKPKETAANTRPCPFCAEPIQSAAVVCRHCGRDVPRPVGAPPG